MHWREVRISKYFVCLQPFSPLSNHYKTQHIYITCIDIVIFYVKWFNIIRLLKRMLWTQEISWMYVLFGTFHVFSFLVWSRLFISLKSAYLRTTIGQVTQAANSGINKMVPDIMSSYSNSFENWTWLFFFWCTILKWMRGYHDINGRNDPQMTCSCATLLSYDYFWLVSWDSRD